MMRIEKLGSTERLYIQAACHSWLEKVLNAERSANTLMVNHPRLHAVLTNAIDVLELINQEKPKDPSFFFASVV